jgi:acyl carrier protein
MMTTSTSTPVDRVCSIVSAVIKVAVDANTARSNTPQWDSLKHIEVMFAIEDEFGVQFSEEELASLTSISAIAVRLTHAA